LVQIPGNQAKNNGEGENKKGLGRLAAVFTFFSITIPSAGDEQQVPVIMMGWVLNATRLHGLLLS